MTLLDPHNAVTAVGLTNSAFSSVKSALELARKTSDRDLKSEIGSALDNVLDLKVKVYELAEENRSLKEQLAQKAKVTRIVSLGTTSNKMTLTLCVQSVTREAESQFTFPHLRLGMEGFAGTA